MATRKFKVEGWNHDASTTATVTMGGVQVFSGAISTAVVSPYDGVTDPAAGEVHYILSWDYTNADDTVEQEVACSIEITAGSASIGTVLVSSGNTNSATYPTEGNDPGLVEIDSNWYYPGNNIFPYGDGSSTAIPERKNILIDGSSPVLLTADAELGVNEPTGGISAPTFSSWQFLLENGSTISYTQRIPELIAEYLFNPA
tara:strand:+ start:91 stop:693 length:603 start_codon:yes stop_codon:yes gene_type:complete